MARSARFVYTEAAAEKVGKKLVQMISLFSLQDFLYAHQLFFILAALWTIPWKGVALWKAARNDAKWWFIALLLLNTLAILEILYIFVFSKKKEGQPAATV